MVCVMRQVYLSFLVAVILLQPVFLWAAVPVYDYEIIAEYKHDPLAFTQGLVFTNDGLYEGTGRNAESSIRRIDLLSGEILQRRNIGSRYFGEGITIFAGQIYQLTWRSNIGFVYDLKTFEQKKTFFLPGEGWGITHDGTSLIVSDGTADLRFLDPQSLQETKRISVTEDDVPLDKLNELEFINGEIWANVWYSNFIVRIDPVSGKVISKVDLGTLYQQKQRDDVLNGIAWDSENKRLFVTGKLWPNLYEIKVRE